MTSPGSANCSITTSPHLAALSTDRGVESASDYTHGTLATPLTARLSVADRAQFTLLNCQGCYRFEQGAVKPSAPRRGCPPTPGPSIRDGN
jgi:hypothetical protein